MHEVLIVEDNPQVVQLLQYLLGGEHCKVVVAPLAEAARACIARPEPMSLVILDGALPDGDGIELLQQIRASATWHAVPVLMLSASFGEDYIRRALAAGANDYVMKPFQPAELLDQVRRLLGPR